MNWNRKCRLCLTDNPIRPVHALQTPELCRLLKDLCRIEIDIHDNMDLVCTNCVQVVSSLKFFMINQKVIEECREFTKDMMVIKEENESSDCFIVEEMDTNQVGQEENIERVVNHELVTVNAINKSTPTESTLSVNDFKSTTKRKSSNDGCPINKELLYTSDSATHSRIVLASDEDTLENIICSKTKIDTSTKRCNDQSSNLKKCKIMLKRVKMSNLYPCPKSKAKTYTGSLKIRKKNNPNKIKTNITQSTTNGNLQPKLKPPKTDQIVTKESKDSSSSTIIISELKEYAANSIASVSTASASIMQNETFVTKSNSQIISSKTIKTTTNAAIECTYSNQQTDQQTSVTTLPQTECVISNKERNGMELLLKLPSSTTCTFIPTKTNGKSSESSSKISEYFETTNKKKLEVPKAINKEQLTPTCINTKPATPLTTIGNEIHNLASINIHNIIPLNSKSYSEDPYNASSSLHNEIIKNMQLNNSRSMKILTVSELNNTLETKKQFEAVALNLRIVRHGLYFSIRIQKNGCAITHSELNAQQLQTLKQLIETISKKNKMEVLFSTCLPDEETKTLLRDLKIDYWCKSVPST